MKHQLGVMSKESITAVRELSESEYEEYKKAVGRLADFSSSQHLYAIVALNYDDYGNILKQYGRKYAEDPRAVNWITMEKMVLDINRHLLNFLSAVRTFLDHTETKLKRHYGSDSNRYKRFKDACSQAYDTNFSYRFLYRLRNFAQHCGLPLGTLTLHSAEAPPHSGHMQHSLEVKFNRDELLLERDLWGNQLMKEIKALPEHFEIIPHVTETMKCLEKINLTVIEDDLQELLQSAEYIQQLVNSIKDMPGLPCILKVDKYSKGEELKLEITNIPFHMVKMVMNIKAHLEPAKKCV